MWQSSLRQSLIALFLFISVIHALEVTAGSNCEEICADSSSDSDSTTTNSTEIACNDSSFSKTTTGIKYKDCLTCLQSSNATKGDDGDVFSYLYNVRYAFDVCLFSYPKAPTGGNVDSPCLTEDSCGSLSKALKTSLVNRTIDNQYDYCDASDDVMDSDSYDNCITCLSSSTTQAYFSNFLVALKAGCEQRPEAGDLIGLSGTLFSSSVMNITDTNSTLSSDGAAGRGTMKTGTVAGIVVGCILGFLCATGLLFLYCRKSRRQVMKLGSPPPETYMYQYRAESDSILPTYSNAHLDKLGAERQQYQPHYIVPQQSSLGPHSALPTHAAYIPQVTSRSLGLKNSMTGLIRDDENDSVAESYTLRAYLNATEEARGDPNMGSPPATGNTIGKAISYPKPFSPQGYIPPPPPPPPPPAVVQLHAVPPPPPGPPPAAVPSIALPSLAKFKLPKKYIPPLVVSSRREPENEAPMTISQPLAVLGARFEDRPLQGKQVLATEAPKSWTRRKSMKYKTPMLSGSTNGTNDTRSLW